MTNHPPCFAPDRVRASLLSVLREGECLRRKSSARLLAGLLCSIAFFCLGWIPVAIASEPGSAKRTWRTQDGKHSIEARLVDYDRDRQIATLRREDDVTVEVEMTLLRSSDRSFILREMRRRDAEARRRASQKSGKATDEEIDSSPFRVVPDGTDTLAKDATNVREAKQPDSADSKRGGRQRLAKTQQLYGIRWQPKLEDALASATGGPTAGDDRPVMWFRVLGDLQGFM